MKKTIIIIIATIIIIAGFYIFRMEKNVEPVNNAEKELAEDCRDYQGKWLSEFKECEVSDKGWCENAGGKFNECASACRHSSDKGAPCILLCVPVCEFGESADDDGISRKDDLIEVSEPRSGAVVYSPLTIAGKARGTWYFEASFPVRLLDANGNELAVIPAQAQGDWMTENFVPFKAELDFLPPTTETGTLVLEKDNPSGLPENANELRIPVKFGQVAEKMKVKVFFNNNKLDPEISCDKVFPVEREVAKTEAVARAALSELLKGATATEKEEGFFTNINSGVEIQKLTIENGIAKVDFNEQLEFQTAGSCRVIAIRAQITETLKQFPTVKDVIISVNGRTEDILQP